MATIIGMPGCRILAAIAGFLLASGLAGTVMAADTGQIDRGAYLFAAAGCGYCHTDTKNGGAPLAGGRALDTPFGRFYTPNISADPTSGIGGWSDQEFLQALRQGIAPDGSYYYPAFPFTSYTHATDQDLLDIKAYIFSMPVAAAENRPHELSFPFGWRALLAVWRLLNFEPAGFATDASKSEAWNRGGYLVQALGHCQECHTPRGMLGGLDEDAAFSGTKEGPDGDTVPNITPDPDTGIGGWDRDQVARVLRDGALPDFDYVGGTMAEVVRNSTSRLTPEDRDAIAEYLLALPAIPNPDARATQP
ncbi:MAG: cytochrome c [Dongiaceae bacterium]